jgi:ATP-dependent Lon protease
VAEEIDQLEEIPIFPLATVLFPGSVLPLHIFEERYKEMMRYAIDNGGLFGMAYRNDAAIGRESLPDIGSIGCVAKINAVVPLDGGRMNIISTGIIRYKVLGWRQLTPFILARIETLSDDLEPGEDLTRIFEDTVSVCRRFLEAAQALDEPNAPSNQELPEDPEAFSLLVASALPVENDVKQNLLEMTSTRLRLTRLRPFVTSALSSYSERIRIQQRAKQNGHGRMPKEAEDRG